MTRLRMLTALPVACLILGGTAEGQARRAMTLVDLLEVPRLSEPQLSPDGRQVLYVLAEADWEANRAISHIWRADTDGGNTVQLTRGEEGETSPRWSPDGDLVAFLTARGTADSAQIHVLSNQGGEARQLTNHPTAVSTITWSPDGGAIYFLAADEKPPEQQAREAERDDVYAFEENFQHRHLWTVTASTGATARVTEGDYSIIDYDLSRDGKRLALHRAPNPVLEYRDASEVWVMGADGSDPQRLTTNNVPESGAQVSPDGSRVLFLSRSNERFEKYHNSNVFLAPAGGGPARVLAPDLPYELSDAAWSVDGDAVFAVVNMGVHSELFRLDAATGEAEQLTDGRHSIGAWQLQAAAGRHVLTLRQPDNPGDVWLLGTGAGATPTRVTRVFDYLSEDYRLPRQEKVEWSGVDGVTVEGLLFYPLDYEEGRRYPLVIQTHGGPQASDKFGFGASRNSIQVLASLGYVVLQPNYRGSTGYGDTFLRDMVGGYFKNAHLDVIAGADHLIAAGLDGERMAKMGWSGGGHMTNKVITYTNRFKAAASASDMVGGYFKNAHLDVIAGADHLIAAGLVDGERMAKMGWSGGGHMTNKVITYTNRFKAAASGAGAANWISMYAQSDTRSQRTPWFGGTPWQVDAPTDLYWEHSPLKHVSNVTTPTIFLVGEDDLRVPMPQSVEMHRALKSLDVPTHLYVAPREGHGWRELRHQLFKMNVELDWFERHVTGRPYVWERAPAKAE